MTTPTKSPLAIELKPDGRVGDRHAFSAEQNAAILARGPLVALSAGAGSGKTTVLVERFIDLVHRDRVSPLEILAITFTEKAAAEMKQRIVRRFEERKDVANRRQAEAAYISTIHGFCARILRENPLAARLDPSFRVMDELTRSVFLDERLDELYADDWFADHVELLSKRYGSERRALVEIIEEAAFLPAEFGRLATTEEAFTVEEHVAAAMRRVREFWNGQWKRARESLLKAEALISSAEVNGPKSREKHRAMCDIIRELAHNEAIDAGLAERFGKCAAFTGGAEDREPLKAVLDPLKQMFKDIIEVDFEALEREEREVFAPLKAQIYAAATETRRKYEEFKLQHGFLDFEDMQSRALELLDDATVRAAYGKRFTHILLDEAQDTNDVQMRIIERLQDGRQSLFAVGDVKQSIYGFRGANVEIFQALCGGGQALSHSERAERVEESRSSRQGGPSTDMIAIPRLRASGAPLGMTGLSLVDNYRSRVGVIDAVNAVGERLWSDGSIQFEPLLPKFPYEPHDSDPRVELWIMEKRKNGDDDEAKDSADDVREREGVTLAAWIRSAVDGDKPLTVYDRITETYRRVQYGDIAILSNSRLPFPAYERALAELGIPFVKDGGREFFLGREVQDLLAAMRVIHNPLDDVTLLATLRSPLFGWGDRDLVRLRVAAGEGALWHGLCRVTPNDTTAAPDTLASLRQLRQYAAFMPPVGLIEMICEVTAYRAALLCLLRGRAQVANIDKLIEFARVTATLDGPSLAAFVHRAELAERYLAGETDAPIAMTGDDVVTISTIHGAKGLEWPVVMLTGLDSDFARLDTTSRYLAPEGALILQYKDEHDNQVRSAGNAPLIEAAKTREEAEARRQLYVGMTRARERLILSGRYSYPNTPSTKNGLAAPMNWLATGLGITAPGTETTIVRLGAADLLVDFVSPERVDVLRAAAAGFRDERLAAARQAVRDGRPVEWENASATNGASVSSDVPAAVARVLAESEPTWATQRALAMTTVTDLVYFFRCPMVYYFDLVLQIDEHPRGRGKAGAAETRKMSALKRGTAVHELLERADFAAEPKAEAARLVGQLSTVATNDQRTIESLLATVLADPLLDRARAATRLEREYRFYLDVGGTTVQGVIDLVFQDADGRGVVVDYKSNDLAAPGRLQTLSELYRPQIELYALAAKQAGLVEPNEATLYFLNKAAAVTTPLDERRLDVVETGASEALGKIARGAWDTEPGEKCRGCGYRKRGFCEVGKRFKE